jgi:cytochrome P450
MYNTVAPDLASPQFNANPYPFYAHLRAEAPVYRATLPHEQVAWLVTRYEDVLGILKDGRFVKDRLNAMPPEDKAKTPWVPSIFKPLTRNMLDVDEPDHTRLRALVRKVFTPRLLEQLRGRIQALCDELLDGLLHKGGMELVSDYALPVPATVIADLLGVPAQDRRKFHRWSSKIVSVSPGAEAGLQGLRLIPSVWAFMRYLRKQFEKRRADPEDDLITALVQAEEAGDNLSEDELLAMGFLLLVAGHETTVNLIASGTLALLEHPEQLEMLRHNPALIGLAVEELLRYTSPVQIATERFAREDVSIAGTTIPRGELVLAVIGSANHDEEQFESPETLDISRDPNKHVAFGKGIHHCLGASLARMEAQIAIATVVGRFPNLRLAVAPAALHWHQGLFLRGLEKLPLTV